MKVLTFPAPLSSLGFQPELPSKAIARKKLSFDLATDTFASIYSALKYWAKKVILVGTDCKCTFPLKFEIKGPQLDFG